MKTKFINLLKGFLTAYAMRTLIGVALRPEWYETKLDYVIGNVYELLGYYDFVFLLFWVVCTVFYFHFAGQDLKKPGNIVMSAILSVLIPMGQCMRDNKSVFPCFSSAVNIVKLILIAAGFFFFFLTGIKALQDFLVKKNFVSDDPGFFKKNPFLKSFLILLSVYSLVTIICYPGNLNADTIGQIYQVYGEFPYSEHHPLLSTLLVGGLVKGFDVLTGSKAPGLFVYTLLQGVMMSAALSFSIAVLAKRKFSKTGLWTLLIIYAVSPVYTNICSTAIKDVPFMACIVVYFVLLVLYVENSEIIKKPLYLITLIAAETFGMLFRNNGKYMIVITGIFVLIYFFKKLDAKERLLSLTGLFLAALILSTIINSSLSAALHAEKVAGGDMLSLPFQMLGRYYEEYPDDITTSERESIEKVLEPLEVSLSRYNPDLADQIKCKFRPDCTTKDTVEFIGVCAKLFFRHPATCLDGILVHTYGWYCPIPSSEKRYETPDDDFLTPTGIFETIDKAMVFIYRFLDRISLLGALENVGVFTWLYIFIFSYQKKEGLKKYRILGVYYITALLICMAAPAFFEHTRYGFPILFTVPFVIAFTCCINDGKMLE